MNTKTLEPCITQNKELTTDKTFTLQINRPFWFSTLTVSPSFTGKYIELIFLDMHNWCLNNLKWANGEKVDLIRYGIEWINLNKRNGDKILTDLSATLRLLLVFFGFTGAHPSDCCFQVNIIE